jgi:hypothetical protein
MISQVLQTAAFSHSANLAQFEASSLGFMNLELLAFLSLFNL